MAFIYNLKTNFTEAKKKKTKQKKEAAKICTVFDRSWAHFFFFLDLVDILDNCRQNMIYVNSIIYKSDLDKQHSIDQYLYLKKKNPKHRLLFIKNCEKTEPTQTNFLRLHNYVLIMTFWHTTHEI